MNLISQVPPVGARAAKNEWTRREFLKVAAGLLGAFKNLENLSTALSKETAGLKAVTLVSEEKQSHFQ